MTKLTKSQLVDENIALRHNLDLSATRIASLEAELAKLTTAVAQHVAAQPDVPTPAPKRNAKTVWEFNPSVKGDFIRASKLAREFGGTVRRMVS